MSIKLMQFFYEIENIKFSYQKTTFKIYLSEEIKGIKRPIKYKKIPHLRAEDVLIKNYTHYVILKVPVYS